MDQKIDWLIHLVANGACDECGEVETDFLPYMCNAHTHGLERYGHLDFQMVLFLPTEEIGRILNTLENASSLEIWFPEFMKTAMCAWMSMRKPGARFCGSSYRMRTISSQGKEIVYSHTVCSS